MKIVSPSSDTVVIDCSRVDHESSKTSPKSVIPALSDENRHFMHRSLNQLPKMSVENFASYSFDWPAPDFYCEQLHEEYFSHMC